MKSIGALVALALVASCCRFASANSSLDKANEVILGEIVPKHGYDAVEAAKALREIYEDRFNKTRTLSGTLKAIAHAGAHTGKSVIEDLLDAASVFEEKKCGFVTYTHCYESFSVAKGREDADKMLSVDIPAQRLLVSFLQKRDEVCSEVLFEEEKDSYAKLDAAPRDTVNQLADIAREALKKVTTATPKPISLLNGAEKMSAEDLGESGIDFFVAMNDQLLPALNSDDGFINDLIGLLESKSGENRCKLVGQEEKVLSEQIIAPCGYYHEQMYYAPNHWTHISTVLVKDYNYYTIHPSRSWGVSTYNIPVAKSLVNEHGEFFHHMIGFRVCDHLTNQHAALLSNLSSKIAQECS